MSGLPCLPGQMAEEDLVNRPMTVSANCPMRAEKIRCMMVPKSSKGLSDACNE
jgi:hypothetical protein